MLTPQQAQDAAATLVEKATKAGASAAKALYHGDASTEINVRLGALEDAQRSESEGLSLTVYIGQQSASVSTATLNPAVLDDLVARAVAMAKAAPEDQYAGLAPDDRLLRTTPPELDLDDGQDPDPAALKERALAVEGHARAVPGVTNSEGGSASAGRTVVGFATSQGFAAARSASIYGTSAVVLAEQDGAMERDYAYRTVRHWADAESVESLGQRAGERAVRKVGAKSIAGGKMPVVLDPRISASLIGHLMGAISGTAIARRTSFLLEDEGKAVFPSNINIIDDPHRLRALGSRPFDGEGLPTARRALVEAGVLTGWLCDSASARQLGRTPTGHAGFGGGITGSNLYMQAGALSPAELMADIADGVYICELIGMGVNPVTGDYSRGAAGFLIKNGQLAEPVNEITIAGSLRDMYANLTAANDLAFIRSTNAPTVRIEGMTVAGG